MSRKRHTITMPGVMLDSIRDKSDYETDERFTKRQKLKGPSVLHRKENRKQQRERQKREKRELSNQLKEQLKQKQKERNGATGKGNKGQQRKSKQRDTEQPKSKNQKILKDPIEKENAPKKSKKRVSFSEQDEIREIPARGALSPENEIDLDFEKWEHEFASDSEDSDELMSDTDEDSQDEADEQGAHNLIETLKNLKKVQREGFEGSVESQEHDEDLDDEQKDVMAKLAQLKGKKSLASVRIVKEDDLNDDEISEEDIVSTEDGSEISDNDDDDNSLQQLEALDDEQAEIMNQLAAIKAKKGGKASSEIRIVKEDDLNDDSLSEMEQDEEQEEEEETPFLNDDEELDEQQKDVMSQLAALKGKKKSSTAIKIVKEDELEDDEFSDEDMSVSEEEEEEEDKESASGKTEFLDEAEELDEEQKSIMAQLAALKGNKKSKNNSIRVLKEDELSDDSLNEEDESEGSISGSEDEVEDESAQSDEEYLTPKFPSADDEELQYYAKKLGKESRKMKRESEDDIVGGLFDGLDFMDRYDPQIEDETNLNASTELQKTKKKEKKEKKDREVKTLSPEEIEQRRKDKEEMNYYAKKLGIDSKKGIKKEGDDDMIGGLLDGLNFDFSDDGDQTAEEDEEESDSPEEEESRQTKGKMSRKGEDGDDEVDSDDFDDDDDLDEDDKALLKEMYGLESSGSEDESEFDSDEEDGQPRVKENPYMAPVDPSSVSQEEVPAGSKYIPPALRKKMAMGENGEDSETLKNLIRLVKGPFNKLSEPNMNSAISDLNNVYNDNPRQFVNEAILRVVLQSICIPTPMLESFLVLYSTAIVALYKLQGIDFGAFVVQKLVEKFANDIEGKERANQELINLTGLMGYLYTLNFVNSSLIYDIIKMKLISDPNELKTDVLLKLIRSCGSKLRTDDSNALTSIIAELTKSVKENERKGVKTSTRSRFLIDTITDLKNNRLKNMESENTTKMILRIKKQLGSINQSRSLDPIKVTLDDIENIEERGKWWLVGSAWKGNDTKSQKESNATEQDQVDDFSNVNEKLINNDDELSGLQDVNWMELARQCRMNTDIRRAIFISIMSAEDFMDAFMKLEKLNLKKSQKAEIPNILMHCATMEATYNPYYSFLAKKLCDDHSMRRSFQLNLWDFIKELDDDESSATTILMESNDDERLWKVVNMGRFFGFLIGEGSLSLNVLRVINFLTASSDVKLFLEIMIVTILDIIAKKSEINTFGSGKSKKSSDVNFSGKLMSERVVKCDEQPLLLKGLQYFLNNKLRKSGFIKGKKQRTRVEWAIDTMTSIIDELIKNQK